MDKTSVSNSVEKLAEKRLKEEIKKPTWFASGIRQKFVFGFIEGYKAANQLREKENNVASDNNSNLASVATLRSGVDNSIEQCGHYWPLWVEASKNLPKDGQRVLVCKRTNHMTIATYHATDKWGREKMFVDGNGAHYDLTWIKYWLPLPHVPNSDKNVQVSDTTEAKSMDEPMAQNTTKEPVIDWEGLDKEFYRCFCIMLDYEQMKETTEWLKTKLQDYIK